MVRKGFGVLRQPQLFSHRVLAGRNVRPTFLHLILHAADTEFLYICRVGDGIVAGASSQMIPKCHARQR